MSPHIETSVRQWLPGDEQGVWNVLKDGSYSLVSSTFKIGLQKSATKTFIFIFMCFIFLLQLTIYQIIIAVLLYFIIVYFISILGAIIYLHGSTLVDLEDMNKSYIEDPDNNFWVAVCDGEIGGTIAVIKKDFPPRGSPQALIRNYQKLSKWDEKVAWLRRMAVSRKFRGYGLAKKLVSETISFCKKRGYKKIFLITTEVHDAARKLYSKSGFKLCAVKPYKYMYGLVTVKTFEYEMYL